MSDEKGKHLLYIDVREIHCHGRRVILKWNGSWRDHFIHPNHTPEITDLLSQAVWNTYSREEREPIINQALKLIAKLPGVEWQYLPDFLLDARQGHLSETQLAFYLQAEKKIDITPVPFIHLNEPYTRSSHALSFEVIGYEIRQKFLRYVKDCVMIEITREDFEAALVTAPLRESYIEHYQAGNSFYNLRWGFPELGYLNTLLIREKYSIPFFFFTKASIRNLITLS